MHHLVGNAVSEGIVRGEAFIFTSGEIRVQERHIQEDGRRHELQILEKALAATRRDIARLELEAAAHLGEMVEIIRTYNSFLDDELGLLQPIRSLIEEDLWDAPTAVTRRFGTLVEEFRGLPEPLPSVFDLIDLTRMTIQADKEGLVEVSAPSRIPGMKLVAVSLKRVEKAWMVLAIRVVDEE